MKEKSIVIIDDHILFARSLKIMIDSFQEYTVVEILSDGQELVSFFKSNREKPDILLLDIRMPGMDGLETMAWLQEHHPHQKVLALSMEDDEATVISMLRMGASGYLLKDVDPEEFFFALEMLVQEGYYHSEFVRDTLRADAKGMMGELSGKEVEFLRLAASELTYREIADQMARSPKTIDGYREALFEKLQVRSRTGLVLFAIRKKLVRV